MDAVLEAATVSSSGAMFAQAASIGPLSDIIPGYGSPSCFGMHSALGGGLLIKRDRFRCRESGNPTDPTFG